MLPLLGKGAKGMIAFRKTALAFACLSLLATQVGAQQPVPPAYPPEPLAYVPVSIASPPAIQQTGFGARGGAPLPPPGPYSAPYPAPYPAPGPESAMPPFDPGVGYGIKPLPHIRFGIDYVFLWHQRLNMPFPTLTTGNTTDVIPGAIGNLSTTTVFQPDGRDPQLNGGRAHVTFWIPHFESFSIDANYLTSGRGTEQTTTYSDNITSTTNKALSRPFFNPNSGVNEVMPISFPGVLSGVAVDATSSQVTGAEINLRRTMSVRMTEAPGFSFTPLIGARWLKIQEKYYNNDRVLDLANNTTNTFSDEFAATNSFFGGQVGLGVGLFTDSISVEVFGKLAMGTNTKTTDILGSSTMTDPLTGIPFTDATRGTYAQPTNVGHLTQTSFTYLPEVGVNGSLAITRRLKASVGYTGFLLNNVVRPNGMIDYAVNPQALQGGAAIGPVYPRPPAFDRQTMWFQTVQLGLELIF